MEDHILMLLLSSQVLQWLIIVGLQVYPLCAWNTSSKTRLTAHLKRSSVIRMCSITLLQSWFIVCWQSNSVVKGRDFICSITGQ